MAKTKDLAALAALGMLGYKMSQNKGDTSKPTPLKTREQSIAQADRSDRPDSSVVSVGPSGGKTYKGTDTTVPDLNENRNVPAAPAVSAAPPASTSAPAPAPAPVKAAKPKAKAPVMSSAQNTALANANQQAKLKAESDALAKANQKAKTTTVVKPTPAATTTPTSSAKPLPANKPAPPVTTSSNRVPTPEQAEANRQALYDKVKGFGSGVVDYVKNFETPAERAARERKAASGMKRGGAVKKMAKGGMTSKVSSASSRADGIASRGKTRCKMY